MNWQICNINDFKTEDFENAFAMASASRKERFLSYKREEDRKRSLAGEVLIKRILADNFNVNAVIECDEKGKPFVANEDVFISISHSGDYVFCAASITPIGADIEEIKPINLKVAKKFATDEELIFIGDSAERFYEVWTAKEAYFKLKGEAAVNFKSFSIFDLKRSVISSKKYFAQIVTKRDG